MVLCQMGPAFGVGPWDTTTVLAPRVAQQSRAPQGPFEGQRQESEAAVHMFSAGVYVLCLPPNVVWPIVNGQTVRKVRDRKFLLLPCGKKEKTVREK